MEGLDGIEWDNGGVGEGSSSKKMNGWVDNGTRRRKKVLLGEAGLAGRSWPSRRQILTSNQKMAGSHHGQVPCNEVTFTHGGLL